MVHEMSKLLLVGVMTVASFYVGRAMRWLRLPSIMGFMLLGVLIGPSFAGVVGEEAQETLSFVTEMALGFVALTIGLELSFRALKRQGRGIIAIILAESFGAFLMVLAAVYALTRNLPLALIFASVAPASAPAGTVAVIQEYRARGSLTNALYAVVGFDDGLGIILFGFGAAIARSMLLHQAGGGSPPLLRLMAAPLTEVIASVLVGMLMAVLFCLLSRRLVSGQEVFILVFGFTVATTGLSASLGLSLILTNMVLGMFIVNTQPRALVERIGAQISHIMPVLFIIFFTLAGANLRLSALPSLGALGMVYALARSAGLVGGSRVGALLGNAEENIKRYLGLGILSQAGVAIGLSLIVKRRFAGLGAVQMIHGTAMTTGDQLGATVITTITVTCILFELIGPILTKVALSKAGEIRRAP